MVLDRADCKKLGGPANDERLGHHGNYGKGTIDCGPGRDTARVRTNGAFTLRNCEVVEHFCAHGSDARGNCLSPSGRPVSSSRRSR